MGKTYVQGEVLNATDLNASFLELKTLPINPQTATYTLVVDDLGKVISATGPVNIPANVFASGGTVSIFNNSTAVINIIQAAGLTLYNASTGVAGSFTLNSRGICSVIFVNTTTAVLTGVGVSVTASGTLQGPVGPTGSFAAISAGSAAAPSIAPADDTNTGMFFPAADTIAFAEGGAEAMRIDSSGNVGIGTTTPDANLEVSGTATKLQVTRYSTDNSAAVLGLKKSRGTEASPTIIVSGDNLGQINFQGYDGAGFVNAGQILVESNGTPGVNDMPGRMAFRLSPDGSATVVTQADITAAGDFSFNSGYGSVATAYGCRAWVNFNGTGTVAIRGSGNVSSIADNGVGLYTINIDTDMPDVNYSVILTPSQQTVGVNGLTATNILTQTAGVITISNGDTSGNSYNDSAIICAAIFR